MNAPFPYLLLPGFLAARNRARRRERGDALRLTLFGSIGLGVAASIFAIVFWLTWQLLAYEDLGDYLVRLGLSWLFLTFLSFVAFSSVVMALSTFFLSEDLNLLLAAPVPPARLFYARYFRTVAQASWMVVVFLVPVFLAMGMVRCAGAGFYAAIPATVVPFVLIPVSLGSVVTLALVNLFPARRARDILMLMGLLFAITLVMLLRFLRPERLLDVQTLPDITGFFATLQTPVTPLLPSFWAGETLFAALQGGQDWLHVGALWTTALASMLFARAAFVRHYFRGWSKAQEARKVRYSRLELVEGLAGRLPVSSVARSLFVKDVKVFFRDTTQWSQLLLLVALSLVYLYNFSVIDLERIPWMGRALKNVYAFVNLAMAAFVLSALAVRFVFPAVSAEGPAFWIIRSAPVRLSTFLWSKFWVGLVPIIVLTEILTVAANRLLGVDPVFQWVSAAAIALMSFALVGLAAGLGAIYPRFNAENITQVSGSYGGVAFMILAVFYILLTIGLLGWPASTYTWYRFHSLPIPPARLVLIGTSAVGALVLGLFTFWLPMQRGIRALERMRA